MQANTYRSGPPPISLFAPATPETKSTTRIHMDPQGQLKRMSLASIADDASAWKAREHGLPVARYTDPGFAQLERDRLGPAAWQVACRLEEIPDKGDYFVYEIIDYSIIVVRQEDMSV